MAGNKPGPVKGYKQSLDHIEKRKRFGPNHHHWTGLNANFKTGRKRAERLYQIQPCQSCGESSKRIDRHHKDGDTLNNDKSNIKFLCRKCHMREDGRLEQFIQLAKDNQPKAVFARWN